MKIGLLVMDGVHAGEVIRAQGMYLMVGRGEQCHVRPTSPLVSERHCALLEREDGIFLRDLESRAGTFLNDRRLRGEIELREGDLLRVGPLTFLVQQLTKKQAEVLQATDEPPAQRALYPLETPFASAPAYDSVAPAAVETQEMPALEPLSTENGSNGSNGHWKSEEEEPDDAPVPPATPPTAPGRSGRRTRPTMTGTIRRPST
jgi:pSer/pThr/pTyr-binding forkhead associated (FHA) protein